MSVRVTIEADWYVGELKIEADDSYRQNDISLTDRIKDCVATAEAQALAAITAKSVTR